MIGTASGAMMAPMFEPELKMPVANARSRRGNHSATVLMRRGKVAGLAESEREARHGESRSTLPSERVAHGGEAPHRIARA